VKTNYHVFIEKMNPKKVNTERQMA